MKWLHIRLGIIFVAMLAGFFVPLQPQGNLVMSWSEISFIFVSVAVGLPLVITAQRVNPRNPKIWDMPSWKTGPLRSFGPIQNFYFGSYALSATGVVVLLRMASMPAPRYAEAMIPLTLGVGTWLGVKVSVALNKSKFAPKSSDSKVSDR